MTGIELRINAVKPVAGARPPQRFPSRSASLTAGVIYFLFPPSAPVRVCAAALVRLSPDWCDLFSRSEEGEKR